jgi:hypothetical protein
MDLEELFWVVVDGDINSEQLLRFYDWPKESI